MVPAPKGRPTLGGLTAPRRGSGVNPGVRSGAVSAEEQVGPTVRRSAIDDAVAWAIVALAPNAILLVRPDGTIALANRQAEEMFGYEPDELLGADVDVLVPARIRHRHRAHREGYEADPRTRPMGSGLDLFATRSDGSTFPVEIALSPLEMDGQVHVVAIVRDIAERIEAQRLLQAAEQELHLLEDRERIARDLHDTVIQRLFAAGMTLQATAAQAAPEIGERVGRVIDELDATIRDIRQAIFRLTAHTLDRHSIRRRIVGVVEQEEPALGFAPEVRFEGAIETVDDERAEELLAVLREALSNVARHARAGSVVIEVSIGEDVVLAVTDDGVGLPTEIGPGRGLGNMALRAEALGGTCSIEAASPRGTTVRWVVPASTGD